MIDRKMTEHNELATLIAAVEEDRPTAFEKLRACVCGVRLEALPCSKKLYAILAAAVVTATIGMSGDGVAKPLRAHASIHSCYWSWYYSGHTDNTRWYHCHPSSLCCQYVRLHICGYSGILHGISATDYGQRANHAHDPGGEGC